MAAQRNDEEYKTNSSTKQLESTIDDLKAEVKQLQVELGERHQTQASVEKELRAKNSEIEEAKDKKSSLLRRIEDLNHEVRNLQQDKEKSYNKYKDQMKTNEELRVDVEKAKIGLQQLQTDKEHTVDLRKEDGLALDASRSRVEKQTKVINKICRDVGKVAELVQALSKEFQLPNKITSIIAFEAGNNLKTKQLDEQLREANTFLKQVGDWLVQFAKMYKQNVRKCENLTNELEVSAKKIASLDTKCHTLQQDEQSAYEKERFLSVEMQKVKDQFAEIQGQQKDGYEREERIHKQNQHIKQQLDACRIQKDKLALQLRSILAEKESLKEHNELKEENIAEQDERSKTLELQISTLVEQKHQILELMARTNQAFPSESLREVFAQIIETVHEGFQIEEEYTATENELISKEGELRQYAKREVDGLLSTKVINIRKDVDSGRNILRELT